MSNLRRRFFPKLLLNLTFNSLSNGDNGLSHNYNHNDYSLNNHIPHYYHHHPLRWLAIPHHPPTLQTTRTFTTEELMKTSVVLNITTCPVYNNRPAHMTLEGTLLAEGCDWVDTGHGPLVMRTGVVVRVESCCTMGGHPSPLEERSANARD